jgi:hypothetical protein
MNFLPTIPTVSKNEKKERKSSQTPDHQKRAPKLSILARFGPESTDK